MAVREVVLEGADALTKVANSVTDFDVALAALVQDMFDTMYAAQGRGLAAPQVSIGQRVFVMDAAWKSGTPTPRHLVNPTIIQRSGKLVIGEEACLSIPGKTYQVARPTWIDLIWQDMNGAGFQARLSGFDVICACHEIDHLNGVMIPQVGQLL